MRTAACLLAGLLGAAGFTAPGAIPARRCAARVVAPQLIAHPSRRGTLAAAVALSAIGLAPPAAWGSGGATAGKYTTIPIAKRRYFGRVKQGVYQFMGLAAALKAGDLSGPQITEFFGENIKVASKRQKSNCKFGGSGCETAEKYTSRWADLQSSMFFLGNAFRMDSGKPPEKVRQVKEAKAFFAEVEKLRKAAAKNDQSEAVVHFVAAREALDIYLNEVDLPPSGDPEYAREADETVPSLCQGSFCI